MEIPKPSRPHIPGYGLPASGEGLLDWGHVAGRMADAAIIWVTAADADNHPRSRPVHGMWEDDHLRLFDPPTSSSTEVAVFVGHGSDAVIIEGELEPDGDSLLLNPRVVFAWTDFTKDMTRWRFDS